MEGKNRFFLKGELDNVRSANKFLKAVNIITCATWMNFTTYPVSSWFLVLRTLPGY